MFAQSAEVIRRDELKYPPVFIMRNLAFASMVTENVLANDVADISPVMLRSVKSTLLPD